MLIRRLTSAAAAAVLLLAGMTVSEARVRIDIKNDSTEDCSVALNARVEQTKWLTVGWYVYAAGEEAPIILDEVDDVRQVYLYHDCNLRPSDNDEVRLGWVKIMYRFSDTVPMDNQTGYEEVTFVRLQNNGRFTIQSF